MICSIVPIKHNSDRVKGKNYRDFNGKPLYFYIINTLLQSKYIDRVIINTNSEIVKKGVNTFFKDNDKIIIYDRPEHLWPGDTPVNKLLIDVIDKLDLNADFYLQTHTTNPLLTVETIDKSIEIFLEKRKLGFDSLFSAKKLQERLYYYRDDNMIAINHNPNELIPTQNLEPIYNENSCIYIFTKEKLISKNHRIGDKPFVFEMDHVESQDIDTEFDFSFAKLLHKDITEKTVNSNKVVLITGTNGGIGDKIAKIYKQHFWHVIGTDIHENSSCEYVDRYIQGDLTVKDTVKQIIDNISKNENKIDCLVNNAAIQFTGSITDFEENLWDDIFNCNVKTIYLFAKYGIELLKKSQGNIINIGSVHSICTSDKIAAYACSKSSVVGLTKNLAIELGKFKIRVNTISPGATDTNMLRNGLKRENSGNIDCEEIISNLANKHILGEIGQPSEIAELVFAVNNNKFINGSNLIIDGGVSIKLSSE